MNTVRLASATCCQQVSLLKFHSPTRDTVQRPRLGEGVALADTLSNPKWDVRVCEVAPHAKVYVEDGPAPGRIKVFRYLPLFAFRWVVRVAPQDSRDALLTPQGS